MLFGLSVLNAQTAEQIAEKYVNAIGGAAKLQAIKSRKADITLNISGVQLAGVLYEDNKNRSKVEFNFQGMKIINAYDGKTAWAQSPPEGMPEPTKLTGAQADAMAQSEFLSEFVNHKSRGMKLEMKGEEELEGKSYYRVDLTSPKGKQTKYYFDKETSLIAATKEMSPVGQETTSFLTEYKEFDGIKMATLITVKVNGVVAQSIKINAVEHNVAVTDALYAFPGN